MIFLIKITIISLFYLKTNSITIYQCANFDLLPQQCMLNWTDKNGNTHISLKTCSNTQICKSNKDYSMGFCMDNLKNVLPGESCNFKPECITNLCYESVCLGYVEHDYCNPKKKDCNPNLSCRLNYENRELAYRCANLSDIEEPCENNDHCELGLVCSLNKNLSELNLTSNSKNVFINEIKNYTSIIEYLNITNNKTCIRRASLKNGEISDEAMACKSGELIKVEIFPGVEELICGSKTKIIRDCDLTYKCMVEVDLGNFGKLKIEEECITSALGHLVCPLKEKEKAWKEYLDIYDKYIRKEDIFQKRKSHKIHIPYDKNTLKSTEISEYFWKYNEWFNNIEADECVKQYFFVNSKSYKINISKFLYFIFIIILY